MNNVLRSAGIVLLVAVLSLACASNSGSHEAQSGTLSVTATAATADTVATTSAPSCVPSEWRKGDVTFSRADIASTPGRDFCIAWRDRLNNELGFRIELTYGGGERFVYNVGANVTGVFVPESDQPYELPPFGPDQPCVGCDFRRKDHQVIVYAILPNGERIVDGYAIQIM